MKLANLFIALALLLASACGGDSGGPGAVVNENPAGHWSGTFGSGGARQIYLLMEKNGHFVGSVAPSSATANDGRIVTGFGIVAGDDFAAAGMAFAGEGATFPNGERAAALTIAFGTLRAGRTLVATSAAGGETARISTTFAASSNRSASLAKLAGTYTVFPPTQAGATATIAIDSTGVATYNTTEGCVGNGSFLVPDASLNVYRWALMMSGCAALGAFSYGGLAFIDDSPSGGTDNALTLYGSTTELEHPFAFVGTKP